MKKYFDYIQDGKTLYIYRGKNQVVELVFESDDAISSFIEALTTYERDGKTENEDLQSFLEDNPEYAPTKIIEKWPSVIVLGGGGQELLIKKVVQERGFKKIEFITSPTNKVSGLGLCVKTDKTREDFVGNVRFFIERNMPFITIDMDQGAYGVVGPFCVPGELACPLCTETRTIANNLLDDFHAVVKSHEKELDEFFYDKIFQEKLITEAVNELYFEVSFGRSNLRNFVRNYNFFTGGVSVDGVLPYPECQCQK